MGGSDGSGGINDIARGEWQYCELATVKVVTDVGLVAAQGWWRM